MKHIVLALLRDRADEPETRRDMVRLLDFSRRPLRSAPVERPAFLDHIVESAHHLFHGHVLVCAMGEDDIYVVHLQALEGLFCALDDVLARETGVVGAFSRPPEKLGGDYKIGTAQAEFFDNATTGSRYRNKQCHRRREGGDTYSSDSDLPSA